MEESQSIGSRIGDLAVLATICFLAYIKILDARDTVLLLGGFMGARYAVKAHRTAVNGALAASSQSGQMRQVRPPQSSSDSEPPPPRVPRPDARREPPTPDRGPWGGPPKARRMSLGQYVPSLVPIVFAVALLVTGLFYTLAMAATK